MNPHDTTGCGRFELLISELCHSPARHPRGRPRRSSAVALAGFAYLMSLTSCATIASDWESPLSIKSNVVGAKVEVFNYAGESIYEGQTPCEVVVDHDRAFFLPEEYRVVVSSDGNVAPEAVVGTSLDEWYFGNALLPGGLVGSLLIDPWTGAMFELDTNEVFVEFDAQPPLRALADRAPHISVAIDSIP